MPKAGIGATANPAEATAAASTRLMLRWFVYMVYLEKRRRNAPTAVRATLAPFTGHFL